MSLLTSLSTKQRILLGGAVAGVLVVAFLLFKLASTPSYTTLQAGIDPAQTGRMTAALDQQGITYQLANNGTALAVESADLAKARVALATQGLLSPTSTASASSSLLDKQKLGASDFQQQVAYQHDLESQIADTIDQISGVGGATVQLTMPKDQLFTDQQQPATAAVLLGGGPSTLDAGAIRGIANLVASSVPNLKPQNVTITDGSGQMLWPTGDAASGGAGTSKPQAEARYDAALAGQLNAIVQRTVGPDKAQVQVQSDLNVDATSLDKLQYARRGTPLTTQSDTESLKGAGAGAGASGVAGTGSNIPTYAGSGATGGSSNYRHRTTQTSYGVSKTVVHTKVAPGAINKLDVALVVDPSVPVAVRNQLQQAVATAAGVQRSRGDTISTSVVPFAKAAVAKPALPITGVLGYAKYAALALGSLLFLFFVGRHLRRKEQADLLGEPVWLRQVESPRTVAELAARPAGALDPPTEVLTPVAARPPYRGRRAEVEDAVQRDPERVAQTLRAWMEDEL